MYQEEKKDGLYIHQTEIASDKTSSSSSMEGSQDERPVHGNDRDGYFYDFSRAHNGFIALSDTYNQHVAKGRRFIIAVAVLLIFVVSYYAISVAAAGTNSFSTAIPASPLVSSTRAEEKHEAFFRPLYRTGMAGQASFPQSLQYASPGDLCDICDCHATPSFYAPNADFEHAYPLRPMHQDVRPSDSSVDINEFMRLTILDLYCARQHLNGKQALKLLRRASSRLEDTMSWSLVGIEPGKPTIYLTTATSPNGRAGDVRPQYFRRHGRAIRSWVAKQEKRAKEIDTSDDIEKITQTAKIAGFQVVWIIAEDEVDIDPLVVRTLRRTGVPYIYFAYGLTRAWGNAQKNAVLQMVYALSRPAPNGILGHGPVYGLDDDNKILPDLMDVLPNLNRIGVVPVGNLGEGWEDPVVNELGEVVGATSPWPRKFPFDYGAFAYNSSLLGTIVSGPSFWKYTDFGGETEFLEQIVGDVRDLEPLCGLTQLDQNCHFVWHNEPLNEVEKMTDDEELLYVRKHGAAKLFKALGFESRSDGDQKE